MPNSTGILLFVWQVYANLLNPFGYRGYCYDAHTGLYYLQSRYYDPNTGRFINADSTDYLNATGTVLGCNLFIYCENDPVNNVDPTGSISISTIVGAIIGFGAGAIILPIFADYKGYTGIKKKWFVALGTAALTVIGGVLGRYIGKALVTLYGKGKTFADSVNKAVAKAIAKFTKIKYSVASGEGYKLTFGKYVIRIMTSSSKHKNYMRISHISKGSMILSGAFSSDPVKTHISITIENLIKLINLIKKLK